MSNFITIIHIITCVFLVLVILIQSGKGAEISASFGGSSQTVFGSSGGQNFFTKFTWSLAIIFMVTSLVLTIRGVENRKSVFEGAAQTAVPTTTAPVLPITPEAQAPGTATAPNEAAKTQKK